MEQEIIVPKSQSLQEQERKDALVLAMEEVGIDEHLIAKTLKDIINNAVTETRKGTIVDDYATKLSALKAWHKFQSDKPDVQIQIANIFQTQDNIL